jgi:hypothetical protein
MANRSYLYSADKEFKKINDLSEANYSIPLDFQILLSADTQVCNSRIWDNPDPIAISGDFKKGLKKLYDFMEYLSTQNIPDKQSLIEKMAETKQYFLDAKKHSDLFLLEAGEVLDMNDQPIVEQNLELKNDIIKTGIDVNEILEKRPADLFKFSNAHWIQMLKKNGSAELPLYWANVLYFSFNASSES